MKKILSLFIILLLIITPFTQVSANNILAEKKIAVKNILITKSELKKIPKGEKYIQAMDNFANKNKENIQKINTVKSKIDNAIYIIKSQESS